MSFVLGLKTCSDIGGFFQQHTVIHPHGGKASSLQPSYAI